MISYAALVAACWSLFLIAAVAIAAAIRQSRRADEARAQAQMAMRLRDAEQRRRVKAEAATDAHNALSAACFDLLVERWEKEGLA